MASELTAAEVRDYLQVTGTTGQYSSARIGSNINAAWANLQQWTGRQFEGASNTKVFSTRGRESVPIPDLRVATEVRLNDAVQTVDSQYYLVPDLNNSGIFLSIEFPGRGYYDDYRRYSDWFDRNLDSPRWRDRASRSLPNDLRITGVWGHATTPAAVLQAQTMLAAWYTKRPESLTSGVQITPTGDTIIIGTLPPEIATFVKEWGRFKGSSFVESA